MGPAKKTLFRLEVGAWCVGLLCVAALVGTRIESVRAQHTAAGFGSAPQGTEPGEPGGKSSEPDLGTFQGVIGRLDVPALGLTVPILNDYDPDSLRRGVGRMKGTGVPGGLGNLVLAGHRDTYFRPLRRIRPGMAMNVVTPSATYQYLVDSTTIVLPEDIDVLDIGDRPEMTLITCYPFDFIGAAPKRFIVHTHLVSLDGETRN